MTLTGIGQFILRERIRSRYEIVLQRKFREERVIEYDVDIFDPLFRSPSIFSSTGDCRLLFGLPVANSPTPNPAAND